MDDPHWWHCLARREDGTIAWFAGVESSAYADRERVELPEDEALELIGDAPTSFADLDAEGLVERVRLRGDVRSSMPGLWFLEVPDQVEGVAPGMSLLAFEGHEVAPDSVRRGTVPGEPPVTSADQLAAVRWYPDSGKVDQIYVAPSARRRGVATALVSVAAVLSGARGEPRLWGDGQRTDLGEAWVGAHDWGSLAAPRTHVAPPMTPGDQG